MKLLVYDGVDGCCKIFEGDSMFDIVTKEFENTGEFFGFKQSELEDNKSFISDEASNYLKLLTDQNIRNYYILRCLFSESYINDDLVVINITNESKPFRIYL